MVQKDALVQLFKEKVEIPLKQIKDNKVNIENYLSNVTVWFVNYKRDEIDRTGFERFLKHLESKTIDVINDVKDIVKPKIIDAINTFLEEVESHTTEEVTEEIESVIKNISENLKYISKRKNMILSTKSWKTPIFIIILLLVVISGIYYMFYSPPQEIDNEISNSTHQNLSQNQQSEDNITEDISDINLEENPSIDESTQNINDAFTISNQETELTSIEKEVFNMINQQRESYYLNKFVLDEEYTRLLKEDSEDILEQLEIEVFIFQLDQELALKGDDIPLAIFNQMNKKNLFNEDLTKIAINIEQLRYKLYRVQLAFY